MAGPSKDGGLEDFRLLFSRASSSAIRAFAWASRAERRTTTQQAAQLTAGGSGHRPTTVPPPCSSARPAAATATWPARSASSRALTCTDSDPTTTQGNPGACGTPGPDPRARQPARRHTQTTCHKIIEWTVTHSAHYSRTLGHTPAIAAAASCTVRASVVVIARTLIKRLNKDKVLLAKMVNQLQSNCKHRVTVRTHPGERQLAIGPQITNHDHAGTLETFVVMLCIRKSGVCE